MSVSNQKNWHPNIILREFFAFIFNSSKMVAAIRIKRDKLPQNTLKNK